MFACKTQQRLQTIRPARYGKEDERDERYNADLFQALSCKGGMFER